MQHGRASLPDTSGEAGKERVPTSQSVHQPARLARPPADFPFRNNTIDHRHFSHDNNLKL